VCNCCYCPSALLNNLYTSLYCCVCFYKTSPGALCRAESDHTLAVFGFLLARSATAASAAAAAAAAAAVSAGAGAAAAAGGAAAAAAAGATSGSTGAIGSSSGASPGPSSTAMPACSSSSKSSGVARQFHAVQVISQAAHSAHYSVVHCMCIHTRKHALR
jgi:hypothetical protein